MSDTKLVENITVLQVSKYGVRVGDQWYNVNAPITPSNFLPNKTYSVSIRVSKTGKKYISEILGNEGVSAQPAVDHERAERVTEAAKAKDAGPDKDTRIQRQGLYQAALQSPGLVSWATNIDEYLAYVKQAAVAGLDFVNDRVPF